MPVYKPLYADYDSTLCNIACRNRAGINILKNGAINTLIALQFHALKSGIKPYKALKARHLLTKALRENHQRYVHAYPTFKIPSSTINNSDLRTLIKSMICSINNDTTIQDLMLTNTRIVHTKHKSIADIFHNHSKFANQDETCLAQAQRAAFSCCCNQFPDIAQSFELPDKSKHIGTKVTDLSPHHELAALHQCARNVPVPCVKFQLNALLLSVRDFLHSIINARGTVLRHPDVPTHKATLDFLKTDCVGETPEGKVRSTLTFLFHTVRCITEVDKTSITTYVLKCAQTIAPSETSIGSADIYSRLKKKYSQLIFSPLDKNTGSTFVCCPCVYRHKLDATFISNANYDRVVTDPTVPAANIDTFLDQHPMLAVQFHAYVRKEPDQYPTPLSYILPKNKNVLKDRPIVSYATHRLKKLLNTCSRAILFCLQQSPIHQYTLWKTHDLLPNLQRFSTHFRRVLSRRQPQGETRLVQSENGDISQMYTALDHNSITSSLGWLLKTALSRRQRQN
jgi:hypothetical protein